MPRRASIMVSGANIEPNTPAGKDADGPAGRDAGATKIYPAAAGRRNSIIDYPGSEPRPNFAW